MRFSSKKGSSRKGKFVIRDRKKTKEIPPPKTISRIVKRNSLPKDIFEAIVVNDERSVKHFVEIERIPLTTLNTEKQTAAHVAAENGNLNLLKYLLKKDTSVLNLVDHYGNNVLFWAAQKGFLDIVKYLVDVYELDILQQNKRFLGNCVIHVAAENGQMAILKYLLEEKHGDVNIRNEEGEPPIFAAADKTQLHIIRYLVEERKANVTITDINDDNILYLCAKTGELAVPKYLLDERKIPFDMDHRNIYGRTVTFSAARFNNLDLVKYFVEEKHADINIADEDGKTPLHEVANIGYLEMVKYFVEKGAICNKTVLRGTTDKDILSYLKKVVAKRTRRSVSELLFHSPTRPAIFPLLGGNYVERYEVRAFGAVVISGFDTLLVIANTCLSFFARSLEVRAEHQSLMSPSDILQSRTDATAVDAANKFPDGVERT